MANKTREELEAEAFQDGEQAKDGAKILMGMNPSDRKAVLLARWFEYGRQHDDQASAVADRYYGAWMSVNEDAADEAQSNVIRTAIEGDLILTRKREDERETLKALERRVENLEAMLGQVLNRLTPLEDRA